MAWLILIASMFCSLLIAWSLIIGRSKDWKIIKLIIKDTEIEHWSILFKISFSLGISLKIFFQICKVLTIETEVQKQKNWKVRMVENLENRNYANLSTSISENLEVRNFVSWKFWNFKSHKIRRFEASKIGKCETSAT